MSTLNFSPLTTSSTIPTFPLSPTFVLDIQDFRPYSPQGEAWGGYPVRVCGNTLHISYDLIAIGGKEYLL